MSGGVVLTLVVMTAIGLQVALPLIRRRHQRRWRSMALTAAQRDVVQKNVAACAHIPRDRRSVFEGLVNQFLHEKSFVGCGGLVVTDDMALTIAAQACVLLLGRPAECFDSTRTILVYPNAFFVQHDDVDESGLTHQGRDLRAGESWSSGQVIVSWHDVLVGAADPDDAYNVVIHEFAHQLDGETGAVNGAPALVDASAAISWPVRMRREYDALVAAVTRGANTFIDPYGATDPAEFFAVLSEVFFEQASDLARRHPDLYDCMRAVYGVDPARW